MLLHAMAEPHACRQRASADMRRAAALRIVPDQHGCRTEWELFCIRLTRGLCTPFRTLQEPLGRKHVYHILCMSSGHSLLGCIQSLHPMRRAVWTGMISRLQYSTEYFQNIRRGQG